MKKRVLAWLLTCCLLVGMLPLVAGADEMGIGGVYGFSETAEGAAQVLVNNQGWQLTQEQADDIFRTDENKGKTQWMWAALPERDGNSAQQCKIYLTVPGDASGKWEHTVNLSTVSFVQTNNGPLVAIWCLNNAVTGFPTTGKITMQLQSSQGTAIGDVREIDFDAQSQPGPVGPAYPENLKITEIYFTGSYNELDLTITLNQKVDLGVPFFGQVTKKGDNTVLGEGHLYVPIKDGAEGKDPIPEEGFEKNKRVLHLDYSDKVDPNNLGASFPFEDGGEYTLHLYKVAPTDPPMAGELIGSKDFKLQQNIRFVEICSGLLMNPETDYPNRIVSQILTVEVQENTGNQLSYELADGSFATTNNILKLSGTIVSAEDDLMFTIFLYDENKEFISGNRIRLVKEENGDGYYFPPLPPQWEDGNFDYITHVNTWLKREYAFDITDVKNVRPAVKEEKKAATSAARDSDVETVLAAINSAADGKSAVTIENSAAVLQNAAAESITQKKADDAIAKVTNWSNKDGNNDVELAGVVPAVRNAKIEAQTSLEVMVKEADLSESGNKSITLDITPKTQVVATNSTKSVPLEGFTTAQKLTVTDDVNLTIPLPDGFAEDGQTIYIKHKGYVYEGTVTDSKVTFTDPHGFSEFEISTEKPVVTTPASPSGGTSSGSGVTVVSTANGTVTTTPVAPKVGDKVTVTVETKAPYYVVTGVTATGTSGSIATSKNADGTYSFTMPATGGVNVEAKVSHIYDLFTDVPTNIAEYGTAIKWAVEQGITLGNSTNYSTFGSNKPCTRGQMVVFLYRAAGSPTMTGTPSFTDLSSDAEMRAAVQWAVENAITIGTSSTTFSPNDPCTRSQMVTFLHRSHGKPAVSGSNSFTDVSAGEYYSDAVQWAVSNGITLGTSDTTFDPDNTCTRVQMVTFLYRDMAK